MSPFRDAWRTLRSTLVVSAIAVASLALGIGANTAIFSIVNSLILRTLPVREPGRLVLISPGYQLSSWSNPLWEALRARPELFAGAFAWSSNSFNLAERGETEFVQGMWASGGMFDALGVRPMLGRALTSQDDVRGGGPGGPVTMISYGLWQRRFGGAADVIGK